MNENDDGGGSNKIITNHNQDANNEEKGQMIANMTGKKSNSQISIPGNQMYMEFHTNSNIGRKGFHAKILESM